MAVEASFHRLFPFRSQSNKEAKVLPGTMTLNMDVRQVRFSFYRIRNGQLCLFSRFSLALHAPAPQAGSTGFELLPADCSMLGFSRHLKDLGNSYMIPDPFEPILRHKLLKG